MPQVNDVKAALSAADGSELKRQLDADGWVEVAGHRLSLDDVEVRAERHAAFALAEDGGWAVALDLELDDELRAEGLARDLVRILNDLRKVDGLADLRPDPVADRRPARSLAAALRAHGSWVSEEVLAVSLDVLDDQQPSATRGHRQWQHSRDRGGRRAWRGRSAKA